MGIFKDLSESTSFVLRVSAEGAELEGKGKDGRHGANVLAEGFEEGNHILPPDYLRSVLPVIRDDTAVIFSRDEIGIVHVRDIAEKRTRGKKPEGGRKPELDERKWIVMLPG